MSANSVTAPSPWAQRMGYGGLLPFVALALAVWVAPPAYRAPSALALLGYAACIASFLGAIHWGLVMRDASRQSLAVMGWGVLPSLLAWLALLLGPQAGLWLAAAILWTCFAVDRVVYRRLQLQGWLPMRLLLTLVASICCLAAASRPALAQQAPAAKAVPVAASSATTTAAVCPALLQHRFAKLQDDSPQNLCQYAGRAVLVVNTASYCGFTSQYQGLEALYAQYQKRGLVVLGFPSNDFGKQEPGSSKEIADLCFNTYGVKFPMFARTVVRGPGKNALYAALEKTTGAAPQWNFHKYLIDRSGKVVSSFASEVEPQDPKLVGAINRALQ